MSGRARDPNDDIEELKQKVRSLETKIAELEHRLQRDRVCYTKKTNELEDEKKALENEVDELKKEIKCLEDKQKGRDARFDSMDEKLEKMAKDLQFFTKKSQDQEKKLNEYMTKTDELEKSRNIVYIGQLCAKVMEAIYWEVLPVYFEKGNDYKQPHLSVIDAKIKQLYETRDAQRAAQRRWEKLRIEKIDPDEDKVKKLVDFMEEMLAERNEVAHPCPLDEEELMKIASNLPGQKQQFVEKVIQISKEMMPTLFLAFRNTKQLILS